MKEVKHIKLGRNNNIYFKKSKKFKTIGISIDFKMKYDHKLVTAFHILSKYLGNCSNKYPSIELLNKYIDSLYGTSLGVKVDYTGSLFAFNVFANYINPKYVNDESLHEKVIEVLHDVIYDAYVKDGKLDETIFNICKENCKIHLKGLKEYYMAYVIRTLRQNLCNDKYSSLVVPSVGEVSVINKLNNENIYNYYKKLFKAPFDIYVTGDFSFSKMEKLIRKYFAKKHTNSFKYSVFEPIEGKEIEPTIIKKEVSQAKVAVAYKIPVLFNDDRHYAFRMARLVLSGTLSSKFGKVIREKLGLCYSINSSYSSYYGVFLVTTGVASENIDKVVKEIDNQINEVKNGNVSDEEFLRAKEAILNDIISIDDSLFGTLNMIKTYNNFNQHFDLDVEYEKYNNVTKNDVIEVAKLLTYCSYVALDKE